MVERDFVLREVARLAQLLAAVLFRKTSGDAVAARQLLADALTGATGLPPAGLRALGRPETLALAAGPDGAFVPERAVALADLLAEDDDPLSHQRAAWLYDAARAAGGAIPFDVAARLHG